MCLHINYIFAKFICFLCNPWLYNMQYIFKIELLYYYILMNKIKSKSPKKVILISYRTLTLNFTSTSVDDIIVTSHCIYCDCYTVL